MTACKHKREEYVVDHEQDGYRRGRIMCEDCGVQIGSYSLITTYQDYDDPSTDAH